MVLKWNIFTANLNPIIGSEQKGIRPVLVISDDDYSILMPLLTILPITSLKPGRKVYPNEVLIEKHDSTENRAYKRLTDTCTSDQDHFEK